MGNIIKWTLVSWNETQHNLDYGKNIKVNTGKSYVPAKSISRDDYTILKGKFSPEQER